MTDKKPAVDLSAALKELADTVATENATAKPYAILAHEDGSFFMRQLNEVPRLPAALLKASQNLRVLASDCVSASVEVEHEGVVYRLSNTPDQKPVTTF